MQKNSKEFECANISFSSQYIQLKLIYFFYLCSSNSNLEFLEILEIQHPSLSTLCLQEVTYMLYNGGCCCVRWHRTVGYNTKHTLYDHVYNQGVSTDCFQWSTSIDTHNTNFKCKQTFEGKQKHRVLKHI